MKANYLFFIKLSKTYFMLDYAALSALATVVREGSFERAARVLHVTPSAISQRIRMLEEKVGCALVVRSQPCQATDAGRQLCQHVDHVRMLEQELQSTLPALAPEGLARVELPLAVNADSLATWLMPAVADFAAVNPVLLEVAVDDQDHTGEWLRNGKVLAAVTSTAEAASGCNSRPLGAMRYVAACSPRFAERYFPDGVSYDGLMRAPSLMFNAKDELQLRWAMRQCQRHVQLPRHTLPSSHAFVAAALSGMGWGVHPQSLIASQLKAGSLVEMVPGTPLDITLYWQYARMASGLLDRLSAAIQAAAKVALLPP